jgi:predicted MFS family arabinose efflux permease
VIESSARGWSDPIVFGALVVAALGLSALVVNERRPAQPIMPLRLFEDRRRTAAYVSRALYLGAMIGFFFFTTQLMQYVYGFSAMEAGLGFLPMSVVNFAVALAVPRLARRVGNAALLLGAGVALTALGTAWLSQADAGAAYVVAVALPMLFIGAGQGLAFAPLTSFGIVDAPAADAGAASGMVNTFHQLGMALGLAVLVALSADASNVTDRFAQALLGSTGLLVACLLVVLTVLVPAQRGASERRGREPDQLARGRRSTSRFSAGP